MKPFIFILLFLLCSGIYGQDDNRYPIKVGDQYGYIDSTGKVVIEPQYLEAGYFSEQKACVKVKGESKSDAKWGYIDTTGKMLIAPKYDGASDFSNGIARVDGGQYINSNGEIIYNGKDGNDFSEGLAWVRLNSFKDNEQQGYINTKGEVVFTIPFKIVYAPLANRAGRRNLFNDGLASIAIDTQLVSVSIHNGTFHQIPQKKEESLYSEPREVASHDWAIHRWGFIDKKGKIAIKPQFIAVGCFSDNLCPAQQFGQYIHAGMYDNWGYINKKGEWMILPNLYECNNFSEGLAAVVYKKHSVVTKWGYINTAGKEVIPPHYQRAFPFEQGMAVVSIGKYRADTFGIIDTKGNWLLKPTYPLLEPFRGALARYSNYGEYDFRTWGYINRKGEIVFREEKKH